MTSLTVETDICPSIESITDPQKLDHLARSSDVKVRRGVVVNRHTSSDTLLYLSNDLDWVIRFCIPSHANCPKEALLTLVKDPFSYVRLRVLSVLSLEPDVLDYGSVDRNPEVRLKVATHPRTRIETLATLSNDRDLSVSETAKARLKKITTTN
jgi:hypothetical protein